MRYNTFLSYYYLNENDNISIKHTPNLMNHIVLQLSILEK